MIESIARQSIIIKCNLTASIMTGNYEFYYASGLFYKLSEKQTEDIPEPLELGQIIQEMLDKYSPKDDKEKHLVKLLRFYKPVEKFDEQMKNLFWTGYKEKHMWQELTV